MLTRKTVSIAVALLVLWLALSGMFSHGLLIALGILSSVCAALLAVRMERVAGWSSGPMLSALECARYAMWLAREIVVANWEVARIILSRKLELDPTVVTLKTRQTSDLTQAIYANSITLTPGTVSIDVRADEIEVHCLTRAGARDLAEGEMDRRVARLTGSA